MVSVNAGRFRTPGRIERVRSDATPGDDGKVDLSDDDNWEPHVEERMEVRAVTANERIHAAQPVGDCTHRITLRLHETTANITPRMRVRIGSRVLNITGAIEVGNPGRLVELSCTEVR